MDIESGEHKLQELESQFKNQQRLHEKALRELKSELSAEQSKVKSLENSLKSKPDYLKELSELQTQLSLSQAREKDLKAQLEDYSDKYHQSFVEKLERSSEQYSLAQIREKEKKIFELNLKVEEDSIVIEEMYKTINNYLAKIDKHKEKAYERKKQIEDLELDLNDEKSKNTKLENQIKYLLEETQGKTKPALEGQIQTLQSQIKVITEELSSFKTKNKELEKLNTELAFQIQKEEEKHLQLLAEKEEFYRINLSKQNTINQLEEELSTGPSFSEQEKLLNELRTQKLELQNKVWELNNKCTELSKTNEEATLDLREQLSTLTHRTKILEEENSELKRKTQKHLENYQTSQKRLSEIQEHHKENLKQLRENYDKRIKKLKSDKSELKEIVNQYEREKDINTVSVLEGNSLHDELSGLDSNRVSFVGSIMYNLEEYQKQESMQVKLVNFT